MELNFECDMRKVLGSLRMCQNFSESVSKILAQIEQRQNVSRMSPVKEKPAPRPFTVSVEGNIGSGKSTYLKHFNCFDDKVDIVMEPVDKWRNLNSHNLLQMMYEDPNR